MTRTGGFAGISRSGSAPVEDLPSELHGTLEALLATPPTAAGVPDRFVYTLRRGDQEATVGEAVLDDNGKRLVAWLLAHPAG